MKADENNPGPVSMKNKDIEFQTLVTAYSSDLYRYGYWLAKDAQIAEDLVQETFLRAWKALDSLMDVKAAKSWLFTILRRENARRFEKKSVMSELVIIEEEIFENVAAIEDSFANVDSLALRCAIKQLPQDYAEPLVLQVLGGYTCEEIGEIMGIKSGAVMTRVFRARQKLRAMLEGEEVNSREGVSK